MSKKKYTEEEQHTAMDKIAGFVYQFYYFLYHLLVMKKGEIVSFEKLDDAAIEKDDYITLYQAKNTVQVTANGEKRPLTNRSTDLWKAIDVWRKLIKGSNETPRTKEEAKLYIDNHEFCYVCNKKADDNKFVELCEEVRSGANIEKIDRVLDEITQEGRPQKEEIEKSKSRTVQMMIDDLKAFEFRREFLKKVKFTVVSQCDLKQMCLDYIADTVRFSDEEAQDVYDDFLCEAVKDFSEQAEKGEPLSYTFEEQKKRFERVFQYHREEKLDFRIRMESYKKEFLDLVCIKQLIKVKDFAASETDKVAKYASYFYSFKNKYDELNEDSMILDSEDLEFRTDAIEFWENEFERAYKRIEAGASEDAIVEKAQDILYQVRKHELKLQKKLLGLAISNGAYYYFSDECLIGWHRDWKDFFKKQSEQDG